jgi:hypothetical protein
MILALGSSTAFAQGRGRGNDKRGIPPGHMPAAGECRVWFDGVPPGRQPRPTSCAEAQRIAAREGGRVIYGSDSRYDDNRWSNGKNKNKNKGDRDDRIYDRRDGSGDVWSDTGRRPRGTTQTDRRGILGTTAYRNGYADGLVKGREDDDRNRSYDPQRHEWYRNASRGYDRNDGSRGEYVTEYRRGFTAAYDQAYGRRPAAPGLSR